GLRGNAGVGQDFLRRGVHEDEDRRARAGADWCVLCRDGKLLAAPAVTPALRLRRDGLSRLWLPGCSRLTRQPFPGREALRRMRLGLLPERPQLHWTALGRRRHRAPLPPTVRFP